MVLNAPHTSWCVLVKKPYRVTAELHLWGSSEVVDQASYLESVATVYDEACHTKQSR